jgi:hypothetical protein
LNKGIISESNVLGWLDCGTSCLEKSACVAFNFKEESKENDINCQLTQFTDHKFERGTPDDNGWTFYEAVGERMVRIVNINRIVNIFLLNIKNHIKYLQGNTLAF